MSLHGVAPEILFQAENDRNFVAAAITRTWVITDANTEVTDLGNLGFRWYGPSLPVFLVKYLFSTSWRDYACKVFISDALDVKYSL
jgi:hypothetical protein